MKKKTMFFLSTMMCLSTSLLFGEGRGGSTDIPVGGTPLKGSSEKEKEVLIENNLQAAADLQKAGKFEEAKKILNDPEMVPQTGNAEVAKAKEALTDAIADAPVPASPAGNSESPSE